MWEVNKICRVSGGSRGGLFSNSISRKSLTKFVPGSAKVIPNGLTLVGVPKPSIETDVAPVGGNKTTKQNSSSIPIGAKTVQPDMDMRPVSSNMVGTAPAVDVSVSKNVIVPARAQFGNKKANARPEQIETSFRI